jgi:chloramphenicol-sensitive protein RarD
MTAKSKGIAAISLAYIVWGLLPVYWKLLRAIAPDRIIAHRIIWSFVLMLLILLMTRRMKQLRAALGNRRDLLILGLAAVLVSVNWVTYIYAVNSGQLVAGSLGYYINPLISIALGTLVYKERFRPIQLIAIALAAAGVAVITLSVGQLPWISLVLATTFGIYGLLKKKVTLDAATGLTIETAILVPAALAWLIFAPASGLISPAAVSGSGYPAAGSPLLIAIIPLAGVVTAMPLLLFSVGTRVLDLSLVGFLQYLAPTLMLVLGVFAYGEPFTAAHAICFGLIWSGLILYTASKLNIWQSLSKKRKDALSNEKHVPNK